MCSKGLLKRMLPFFATFAAAIFITSFFVDLSTPRFGRGRFMRNEMRRLESENNRLRQENEELHEQLVTGQISPRAMEIPMDVRVPIAPQPPIAPLAPRVHR